jgi:hypothetical protein
MPGVLATRSGFFAGKAIGPGLLASFTSDYFTMIFLPSIVKSIPLNSNICKTADAFEFREIRP